jgi:hypothetical protein
MAILRVRPDELKRTNPDDGIYEGVLVGVSDPRATRYDPAQQEVNWHFRITDDSEFSGLDVFASTNIEKGKGDTFLNFARSMGPKYWRDMGNGDSEFDTDLVKEVPVRFRVANRISKNKTTKAIEKYSNVAEIIEVME